MGGILILAALVGALFAWIFAGIKGKKLAGNRGVKYVLLNLLFAVLSIVFLWVIIVVPSLDCSGFLCGLGAFILFFVLGIIVLLIWPLILLATLNSKFKNENRLHNEDDNLLDS